MICPGTIPITNNREEDDATVFDFAGIVNIFGSSSALTCIVFFCRIDSEKEDEVLLLLTRIAAPFLLLSLTLPLISIASILFPSRKTSDILKDSKSSNSIKSALKPGAIAPISFNPKYLAVLI